MNKRILITGSEGLVGHALADAVRQRAWQVKGLDVLAPTLEDRGDVRDADAVSRALAGCSGVVHLAAVSRVILGERSPELCWDTNVGGTRNVLAAALNARPCPWVVLSSSREVYGQPDELPANEDAPLAPVNIYGRSKVEGERLALEAREAGLRTGILRLSNVYGVIADHADRVVPAFARAAATGARLRVDGDGHNFDLTHVYDTIRGMVQLIEALEAGESALPPIHLLTGRPTTLGELAELAVSLGDMGVSVEEGPPRSFDVSHFYGDPSRALALLGWRPRVHLWDGLRRLINDFRTAARRVNEEVTAP